MKTGKPHLEPSLSLPVVVTSDSYAKSRVYDAIIEGKGMGWRLGKG